MGALSKPDELDPWEEQFAKWLGRQPHRVSWEDEKAVLRVILGKDPFQKYVRAAKRKLAFKQAYQAARTEMVDLHLAQSRTRYAALLPVAAKAHRGVVEAIIREVEKVKPDPVTGKSGDALPLIRAAGPVLNPFIDRALPRKSETNTTATNITISLTPDQIRGLDAPRATMIAEDVPATDVEISE